MKISRITIDIIAEQATSSYGAESGRLLVEIMGVNEPMPYRAGATIKDCPYKSGILCRGNPLWLPLTR